MELLKEESPNAPGNIAGVQLIPIEKIRAFRDHPFRLYEGERLDDMVQSVRDHGILNPVIVRKVYSGYEMLAGHNRMNAAQIAGMTEVPAIVKADLSDEEAYVYVIETNVIQRSFTDLTPSEKAAVLSARYEKVISQGRRNDILQEIEEIGTCGHDVHKSRSRDGIGEECGMTGRNIARYMRVDKLIRPFKDRLDAGELTLTAAVELSYLPEDEQIIVAEKDAAINEKTAKSIMAAGGELTEDKLEEILHPVRGSAQAKAVSVKIPAEAEEKYFSGMKAKERTDLVMKAPDARFSGKEAANVQQ
ncbi:ParB N-terminal domain-containing protein [Porcincola intestinalis]|uniref:ParB N-terminal domain-containing protein n=1 Tax=Porcincola intestinalis TaxID=2606632 RepID=UPI002E26128E|nr:ParB/RepB/Spo0J family partition protein [Porcincola intestinalis]